MSRQVAWSYSALNSFETCPWRYYETKIAKSIQEPQTEATLYGNRVHKAFEERLTQRVPFPETLKQFEPTAKIVEDRAEGKRLGCEIKMALTKNLDTCKWFDKSTWVRAIADVTIDGGGKLAILDWKTGKPTPDSKQLALSAAVAFATRPWIREIINTFVWLQTGGCTTEKFTRDDIPAIWNEFNPRVARLQAAIDHNKFPKRQSGLCRNWCPVHTCEFNGKYHGKK